MNLIQYREPMSPACWVRCLLHPLLAPLVRWLDEHVHCYRCKDCGRCTYHGQPCKNL
jgi:hypothetical protein